MERHIIEVLQTYGAVFVASRITAAPCLCYPLDVSTMERLGEVARRTEDPRNLERIHYEMRAFWPDGSESVTWTACTKHGRRWYLPNFDTYYRALVSEKTGEKYGPEFLPCNKVRKIVSR